MWTSYPWVTMWRDLTYTSYCFTFSHYNATPLNFAFDTFFCGWNWTWKLCEYSNFHSSQLFWNYFHPYNQPTKSFIQTIHLLPIIIQKFIHVPRPSKYFILFVIVIHVDVVFIWHNCFGINSIHTFQHVNFFIQIIRQLVIIIQKFHWFSTFIQTFHPFGDFHPCTYENYFPHHSYMA